MNEFYDSLSDAERTSARDVAFKYGRMLRYSYDRLLYAKAASDAPYYVGLSSDLRSFTHVTRRVVLVADTVLLSDHGAGTVHELGLQRQSSPDQLRSSASLGIAVYENRVRRYGMVTTDPATLGRWLLNAEPLLRTGLVWYGPVFVEGVAISGRSVGWSQTPSGTPAPLPSFVDRSIDFVVKHGRAVDLSNTKPLASRVVRPVLEIDLPFLAGLSLNDFARATSEEFDSYRRFRDFMRARLLELDGALQGVDSQVAMERIALSIREELNAATAELTRATRSGALNRCGAVLATSSAVLAAVRPEALAGALGISATIAAGATGVWPTIQAFADAKPKRDHDKWHYVWVLQQKARR